MDMDAFADRASPLLFVSPNFDRVSSLPGNGTSSRSKKFSSQGHQVALLDLHHV